MRAYLSSAAVLLCGAVLWLLLLQRGLTRIGLAQCACTNAECSSVLATIGSRIVTCCCKRSALASCKTLGMKHASKLLRVVCNPGTVETHR